jgi:hypothetical protein
MKKLFFALVTLVAFSFTACQSGEKKTETMDTTQVEEMKQDVDSALDNMPAAPMDTASFNYCQSELMCEAFRMKGFAFLSALILIVRSECCYFFVQSS